MPAVLLAGEVEDENEDEDEDDGGDEEEEEAVVAPGGGGRLDQIVSGRADLPMRLMTWS